MNAPLHKEMPRAALDDALALEHASAQWDNDIVAQLREYIRVPAKSPGFDANWSGNGHIETVLRSAATWVEEQKVPGLRLEIVRIEGRTPVLFFELDATRPASSQTVLNSPAGATTSVPGPPNTRMANCTAEAAPTTATQSTPASLRSRRSMPRACHIRASSA
jgi:hypothetical protein